jgi:hypothetical protein
LGLFFKKPAVAAFMSFLLPGLGQAAGGKVRRGLIVATPAIVLFVVFGFMFVFTRRQLLDALVYDSGLLLNFLVLNIIAGVYHVWAVFDAYLGLAKPKMQQTIGTRGITVDRPPLGTTVPVLLLAVVITAGLHTYLGALEYRAQTPASQVAAATPTSAASGSLTPRPSTSPTPDPLATPTPVPTPQTAPSWVATSDRVKVHTGPGIGYQTITFIPKGLVIGGWVVTGGDYTYNGATRNDWIEMDVKPVSRRFVARAYFEVTDAPAGSTVTPTPAVSPSPTGPEAP